MTARAAEWAAPRAAPELAAWRAGPLRNWAGREVGRIEVLE